MKDKSIRDTAIITITLIGGLFLLQKCSGDEVKIVKRDIKISQIEGHSQKDTLQEGKEKHSLVDNSYITRDNEIVLASYKSASDTNDTKEKNTIETKKSDSSSSQIIVSTSKDINKTVSRDNLKDNNKTIQVATEVVSVKDNEITPPKVVDVPKVTHDIPKVVIAKNITKEADNNTTETKDTNITKEADSKTIEIKDDNVTKEVKDNNITENINITKEKTEAPTVDITIPKVPKAITSNIEVPVAVKALDIEKNELNRAIEEREKDLKLAKEKIDKFQDENKELTIEIKKNNQQIHKLEEKINTALYNSDNLKDEVNKLKEELKFNQERREKALKQKAKLEAKLAVALEENRKLETELNSKNSNSQELVSQDHTPIDTKISNLKFELNQEREKANELKEKNSKILDELKIKEAKLKDFDILSSKYKKLEANLTNELKSKELLLKEKIELENKLKLVETDLSTQKAKLEERVKKLKDTIIKIFIVNKKDRLKASEEYNSSIKKLEYKQKELEHNLSLELEKELSIMNEKTKLEEMVKSLEQNITAQKDEKAKLQERIDKLKATVAKMLSIAKEKGQEALVEYNTTVENCKLRQESLEQNLSAELEKEKTLADEKAKLEDKVSKLEATIKKMLSIAKEKTDSALVEYNTTIQQFKSKQKSLEQNLSAELEKEKTLADEKAKLEVTVDKLKATITKMLSIAKEKTDSALVEYNTTIQQFKSKQKSLEQNLSAELEKEKALADEKAKLEDRVKSLEDNITTQIDEKAQLTKRIDKLKATVAKMLSIAKEKTEEASAEYNRTIQNFISKQKNLEQNLSAELEKEKALADEKDKLENMVKLLEQNIATKIDEKGQLLNKINKLKSQKSSIEQNLSAELEKEKALADEKAKLEDMVKSLEDNITTQIDEKAQLSDKINELKSTIDGFKTTEKEKIEELTQKCNAQLEELKSQKVSVEQNLSVELEKEKALVDEKSKLEDMVKSLEDNITTQIDEKAQLEAKIDELNRTIATISTDAKEELDKATQEFNSKLEALKSQKLSIEQNLSTELEKEKALADEKSKLEDIVKSLEDNITTQRDEKVQLEVKIDELKTAIDNISAKAKDEKEKIVQEFNSKLQELEAQKASIEENLTKQTEKLQEVMEGNSKLKEELIQQKADFEEQLKTKESEIEKLKFEKEEAIKKEEAKQVLLKTFLLTNVQFKRASSQLTDESKARLDDTAKKMLEYPNFKYEIQGHTDKSGKEEYNIKLSTQRAEATKKYLVSKGVPEEMLITKGFGSSQPIADNKTREGRIKNRRVVFVIRD